MTWCLLTLILISKEQDPWFGNFYPFNPGNDLIDQSTDWGNCYLPLLITCLFLQESGSEIRGMLLLGLGLLDKCCLLVDANGNTVNLASGPGKSRNKSRGPFFWAGSVLLGMFRHSLLPRERPSRTGSRFVGRLRGRGKWWCDCNVWLVVVVGINVARSPQGGKFVIRGR